jgi:DNA-binding transcriptional MerR regulator
MVSYTIGEVARRSGFTSSALRYYEGIGLVEPAARTAAGYRVYDDHALARLAFIARAKQLGCSLEEITDLAAIWDGERCGPVQRRFHDLVTDKLAAARRREREMAALTEQLESVAEQLAGEPSDGPCGDTCACMAGEPAVTLRRDPRAAVPIACTLDRDAVPERVASWRSMLSRTRDRALLGDGRMAVQLDATVPIAALAELVAAEQRCCSFLSFAITVDARGVALEVRGPADALTTFGRAVGAVPP